MVITMIVFFFGVCAVLSLGCPTKGEETRVESRRGTRGEADLHKVEMPTCSGSLIKSRIHLIIFGRFGDRV